MAHCSVRARVCECGGEGCVKGECVCVCVWKEGKSVCVCAYIRM